jgi:hypothetical protein
MRERPAASSDRIIVAELTGEAQRHAGWEPPDDETTAAAVAELRDIAGGRTDLLAEVAGIFLGTSEGEPHEPRARNAADLCRAAGADPDLIPRWVEAGRRRAAQARKRPFGMA